MSNSEQAIEEKIVANGLTAPRLTPDMIDDSVFSSEYHVFKGRLTVCCMTLANGFMVTGESSCVSVENFDEALGQKIAFDNARDKIWMLEGYLLRQRLHEKG